MCVCGVGGWVCVHVRLYVVGVGVRLCVCRATLHSTSFKSTAVNRKQ